MNRHLLKLVWNRKKTNALVVLEIFISFVVVFAVAAIMAVLANNYRQPLGFSYHNVLTIVPAMPPGDEKENAQRFETVLAAVRSTPGVESVAGIMFEPYFEANNTGMWEIDGRRIEFDRNYATDDFAKVMGLNLVEGRWFSREDDGSVTRPIVLDRGFARVLYGDEPAVGKEFDPGQNPPFKVIGVIDGYRTKGEYSSRKNYSFHRANPGLEPLHLVARLEPGAYTPAFENTLVRNLERIIPGASFVAKPLEQQREVALRFWLVPVWILGLIGGFLIFMVALGLTGVMWQNVTQRTRELGLRRALGAERGKVRTQILAEIVIIATLGLILGVIVVAQVPLMGLFELDGGVFLVAVLSSLALIYGLALVCGLYPSWLASRIEPATALHYE